MSRAVSTVRSHFFKHLVCTSIPSSHRLSPPTFRFSERRPLIGRISTAASFSRAPPSSSSSSSLETPATESYTSPYLSVRIRCQKHVADMLSEALLCFGASSTSIDKPDIIDVEDEICISSVYAVSEDVKESISLAVDSIGLEEIPSYEVVMCDHTDWIKGSQESFYPVEVAEGIWIVPEWIKPPDLQATNIIINPGLAFGTGDHPTTKLCLLLLHSIIKGGERFFDYGTGSGVLAIAALKFGAAFSTGVDIDPQAIEAARCNGTLNSIPPEKLILTLVPSKASTIYDDITDRQHERVLLETEKFDVVVANILLNPLLDLADHIVSFAKPGATVGLSGIISEQVPRIIERYSPFLEGITVSKMDDWACITGLKKRNSSLL